LIGIDYKASPKVAAGLDAPIALLTGAYAAEEPLATLTVTPTTVLAKLLLVVLLVNELLFMSILPKCEKE